MNRTNIPTLYSTVPPTLFATVAWRLLKGTQQFKVQNLTQKSLKTQEHTSLAAYEKLAVTA